MSIHRHPDASKGKGLGTWEPPGSVNLADHDSRGSGTGMKLRLLRLLLLASAFAWAVSAVGVVLPWPAACAALRGLGAGDIPADRMLDYWLRRAAGEFTGVGIFFLALAIRPARFANVIGLAGGLMFAEGVVLLVHGLRLGLPPLPFYADTGFCLLVGGGIWVLRKEAGRMPSP